MDLEKPLSQILKAVLFSSNKPVNMKQMTALFPEDACPSKDVIETALEDIREHLEGDVFELRKLASGYAIQIRQEYAEWVGRLVEEKPPRYSRAVLETMAIIAYRQPITRSEIEEIRGVAVNTVMVKTLLEREWIRVIGHKDVPGKPAIYGTTQTFLDYFNLSSLTDLPPIGDIKELTDAEIEKIESLLEENQNPEVLSDDEEKQVELPLVQAEDIVADGEELEAKSEALLDELAHEFEEDES
jgi:segregation and condensation protein B